MKLRITSLILSLVLLMGLFPNIAPTKAVATEAEPKPIVEGACSGDHLISKDAPELYAARPTYNGKLIDITPQRVEDTFNYLDELYVERYPEAALMLYTGTEEDREVLTNLANVITEDCKTNTEKANAIDGWLRRNIYYDVNTSAYASDTFYRREGNCLSYAHMMQFLLRALGVPAVVGDGWRGNMAESTTDLFNQEGHAWCFVYLEGEWVLYDPLWLEGGTTDREYMAKWIYLDQVEFICPVEDENDLPPEAYDKPKAYYSDGRAFAWSEYFDNTLGVLTSFVNNQAYAFVCNQCDGDISDGMYVITGDCNKDAMEQGELYYGGWCSYGNYNEGKSMGLSYYFPNGMTADGYVANYDGIDRFMYCNTSYPILADEEDYFISDGNISFRPGYSGPFLSYAWTDGCVDGDTVVTWEALNPEIVSVDQQGNITCHQEGYADISVTLQRIEKNGNMTLMSENFLSIIVSNEERIPDYNERHFHQYTEEYFAATCTEEGYSLYVCDCGESYRENITPPLGHDHSATHIPATCTSKGYMKYECYRCGDSYKDHYEDKLPHEMGNWYESSGGQERRDCHFCNYYETRKPTAPAAPVIKVSSNASDGKPKITWTEVYGASQYKVYRSTSKNGTYSLIQTVSGTSYINANAKAGTLYYYKVKAVSAGDKTSGYSNIVSRTCDLPRPVVKVSNVASSGKIKLTWNKVAGATSYKVYRATSKNGKYSPMKTVSGTSYTNTSAKAGTMYYYKVVALHSKSAANSAYSSYVSRTCDLPRPTVSISRDASGKPKLSWDKVEGAKSYKIYRSTSKDGTYSLMKTVSGTSYVNTNAKAGKTYYYKVIAVHNKSAANSAYSSVKIIKSK